MDRSGGESKAEAAARPGSLSLWPYASKTSGLSYPPPTHLVRRAKLLAWSGNAWHLVEFAIAVGAGVAAGSIALVGFGIDSLIEGIAGFVIVWRFGVRRHDSERAERRAQQLVAASYLILVLYIVVEATRTLVNGDHPDPSWVGIGLAAFTAPTMPLLARAKRRVGRRLGSAATVSEAEQNRSAPTSRSPCSSVCSRTRWPVGGGRIPSRHS